MCLVMPPRRGKIGHDGAERNGDWSAEEFLEVDHPRTVGCFGKVRRLLLQVRAWYV